MLPPTLHLVTDRSAEPDLIGHVRRALRLLPPGTAVVHVRDKACGGGELLALARAIGGACRAAGQLFYVNDRIDVALASGADGVHLPAASVSVSDARRLLGSRFVGVSCHSVGDVRRACEGGADYATFGPVFDTPSKRAYGSPVGIDALREAAGLGLPLVALGGIGVEVVREVRDAGAYGIGVIRAWLAVPDPVRATLELAAAVRG